MRSILSVCAALLLLPVVLLVTGCGKSAAPNASTKKETNPESAQAKDGGIEAALAALTAEDRALAEKQKVCPVSGESLGLMGTPVKIDVKGQAVFICCEGCKDKLLADPDKYLAKLSK